MIKVRCLYDKNYVEEQAYDIHEFPYDKLDLDHGKQYIKLPATFDIETSTINKDTAPDDTFPVMLLLPARFPFDPPASQIFPSAYSHSDNSKDRSLRILQKAEKSFYPNPRAG